MSCDLKNEKGFTLIEVTIALLVMTVMMMGVLTVFTYTVQYNRGNNLRSQALSVLQQEAELYRSAKFTPSVTDPDLQGGVKPVKTVSSADGTVFSVTATVDNDPGTTGTQTSETLSTGKACTLKEISLKVLPKNQEAGWITAESTSLVIQRVRSN
jgi:prepilin-type N-terminal cleavage/methylation domain-containing protein